MDKYSVKLTLKELTDMVEEFSNIPFKDSEESKKEKKKKYIHSDFGKTMRMKRYVKEDDNEQKGK